MTLFPREIKKQTNTLFAMNKHKFSVFNKLFVTIFHFISTIFRCKQLIIKIESLSKKFVEIKYQKGYGIIANSIDFTVNIQ